MRSSGQSIRRMLMQGVIALAVAWPPGSPVRAASAGEQPVVTPDQRTVPLVLSDSEKAWLAERPVLRVGADPDWPPFSYFGRDGRMEGIDADILSLLAPKLGVRFEVVRAKSWAEIEDLLKERKIDFTVGTAANAERTRYARFTEAYLRMPVAVITREDGPFFVDLAGLRGRTVASPRDHVTTRQLASEFPDQAITLTENLEESLRLVASGKADACVAGLAAASYIIKEAGLTNLKIAGITPYQFHPRFAVRPDQPELASILDRALDSISQIERMRIVDRWIAVRFDEQVSWAGIWRTLLVAGLVAGLAFLLVVLWNRRLARELDERRRVEAALRESRTAIEDANRRLADLNAEKDHLLGMAAHDLNSPLTTIIMSCEMLRLDRLVSGAEGISTVRDIQQSAERMSRMVRNLLNLRAIEQGGGWLKPSPVDPAVLVHAVTDRFENPAALKSILLHFHQTTGPRDRVLADRDALDQIVDNLVSNAVKFTPPGGEVTVSVEPAGDRIRIAVADTGPGIPDDETERLFGKFARLSTVPTGGERSSGLGLSIVKRLAEMMNGKAWYEPAWSGRPGARFVVDLPRG